MKTQLNVSKPRTPSNWSRRFSILKKFSFYRFSETSKKAVQYALRFAEQFGCEIALLYVVEPATPMIGAPLGVEHIHGERRVLDGRERTGRARAEAHATAHIRLVHWCASGMRRTRYQGAKDLDVDLIIIATHGYTSWRHFCIGSTAERVVRTAPCPGLVVA